jgi:signal transduction histidine kinase
MKKFTKILALVILLVLIAFHQNASAQTAQIDSLKKVLERTTEDNKKIELLGQIRECYMYIDMKIAGEWANKMLEVAEKNGDDQLKAIAYNAVGTHNIIIMDSSKAINYLNKGLKLCEKFKDTHGKITMGNTLVSLGTLYHMNGMYKKALPYYLKADLIYSELKEDRSLATVYSRLTDLFKRLGQQDKYELYTEKLLDIAKKLNDNFVLMMAKTLKAEILTQKGRLNEAEKLCEELLILGTKINNQQSLASTYGNLGIIAKKRKQFAKSVEMYQKSSEISLKQGLTFNYCEALSAMSEIYYELKQYNKGLESARKAIEIAKEKSFEELLRAALQAGSLNAAKLGQDKFAYTYLKEYLQLYEKNVDTETRKQIAFAAEKFESEKRVIEIKQLKAEKQVKDLIIKRRNLLMYGLTGLMILMVFVMLMIYRNIQHRKQIILQQNEIKEQKIQELEKEKMLVATRAVMQGEEKERTRLARDLHDSLGGMLSGIKLKLSMAMKGNVILPEDMAVQFENALGLLDSTIGELRQVANNLMPESLLKFGLKISLEDFCNRFNEKDKVLVHFQFYGEEKRQETEFEIAIYRIVQELISNAIKHGNASKIDVQLIIDESRICLQVMDNGIGFDRNLIKNKGRGLKNIENRVAALNGNIDIQSTPGKGTETSVEFSKDFKKA